MITVDAVRSRVRNSFETIVADLVDLVAIPSVSVSSYDQSQVVCSVEYVVGLLRKTGQISGALYRFSAIGWQHDAERLNMTLNLPAGWRLLHALGVDCVGGAWLAQWNLLDFFLVMLTALAAGRLWGVGWGAVALLDMMLVYQEADAPT